MGYHELSPTAESVAIEPEQVARLAKAGPLSRFGDVVGEAIQRARRHIAPRVRWRELDPDEVPALFAHPTPVQDVAGKGRVWAFVATLGGEVEARAQEDMRRAHFLEGMLLDAAASIAADSLAALVQERCADETQTTAERFSPGYCHWAMASQPALFDLLAPQELGVELLPSFLMNPLKSVSGIVVCGQQGDLRVSPEACSQCDAAGCTRRQAGRASEPVDLDPTS